MTNLLTVKQLSEAIPAFTENSLRVHIFNAKPHIDKAGTAKPGNGLAPAIIRVGGKVLINKEKFIEWVEGQGGAK